MKHFFSLLLLLSCYYSASSQCTYVVDLQDSYGDGWDGASLNVSINGIPFNTYTILSGSVNQVTINANNLDIITFTYNAGNYDNEVTYQISSGGVQLFADGTYPSVGLVFTHQCGSCDPAWTLNSSNITATSVDLGWMSGGGGPTDWIVEYGPVGFLSGLGTSIAVTTNSASLTGLTENSMYEFYVSSICSSGDTSLPAGPASFSTLCLPVTVFPFWEGFNSNSPTQNCWTVIDNNGDGDAWNMNYTMSPFEGDESAAIQTDYNQGNNDDYLISPQMLLTGRERLRFKHRCRTASEPNDFRVLVSTTGIAPADFTNVVLVDTSSEVTYKEAVVDLSAFTGEVFIAFEMPNGGLDGWVLFIDDVMIDQPTINDAGVTALSQLPPPHTGGFRTVELEVTNFGVDSLTSFSVEWEAGGVAQPTVIYSGAGIAPGANELVLLGNVNFPASTLDMKFWTTLPNGQVDENFDNDTLNIDFCLGLSGIYTAGHPSSDFPTGADAINALMNCGVAGAVTIEFQAGTYTGPWLINKIPGSNATNTVTFDGLDASSSILTHNGLGYDRSATLVLDGAEYFTIKNFMIQSTGVAAAYGVLLINNANHNTIEDNNIMVPVSSGLTNVVAVLASASYSTSIGFFTEGNNANWNTIQNNEIRGGVAGIILEGGASNFENRGNKVIGNKIHDAEDYGIYVDEQDSFVMNGNEIYDITGVRSDAALLSDFIIMKSWATK